MSTKLGICTRYHRHEHARAAIQLADAVQHSGIPVSLRAAFPGRHTLSPYWDSRVVNVRVPFARWVADLTHVLWIGTMTGEDLDIAQNYGITTWVFGTWDTIQPDEHGLLCCVDRVLAPYECIGTAFSGLVGVNTCVLPWDVPVIRGPKRAREFRTLRILVPLFDSQAERVDLGLFALLRALLKERTNVHITVAKGHNYIKPAKDRLRQLTREFGPRVTIVHDLDWLQRMQLYAAHDITLWLPRYESLATIGLESLKMGTPVVTWRNYPQLEYLETGVNAWLVPCELCYNWLGMGEVISNYAECLQLMLHVIDNEELRVAMKKYVSTAVYAKRNALSHCLETLW